MSNLELIKKLRDEMGGIGMADCKKALEESDNNYEKAVTWLRKKGLSKAAKVSSKTACEGLVAVNISDLEGTIIEVNSETDFVSQNQAFIDLVTSISNQSIKVNSIEALKEEIINGTKVEEMIVSAIAGIGEKIDLRRMESLSVKQGVVAHYIHNANSQNSSLGRIGVLIGIESSGDTSKLKDFGKKIGMHIASCVPKFLKSEEVSQEEIQKEKDILIAQAASSGKPQAVIEKMVEGRMSKFYSEIVLLEQAFVMDPSISVKTLVENFAKEIGTEVKISGFKMLKVGEGIEKKVDNFAEEVASMTK